MSDNQSFYTDIRFQKHQSFWTSQLGISPDMTEFIGSVNGNTVKQDEWKSVEYEFGEETNSCLKKYTAGKDLETFVLMFSAFAVLTSRYNQVHNISLNTPPLLSGPDIKEESILIPHLLEIDEKLQLREFIGKFNESVLNAYQYQDYPLNLIEGFDNKKATSLSNVVITFDGVLETTERNADLNIHISQHQKLKCEISYNSNLYDDWYITNLANNFDYLLRQYANLNTCLSDLEIVAPVEKTHLLETLNSNFKSFPLEKTCIEIFHEIVEKFPDQIATQYYEKKLTYKQLDNKGSELAQYLKNENQIKHGDRIAVMIEKSDYSIISLIAIFKLGAIYVPIDPEIPLVRKNFMLADANVACLLTSSEMMFDHHDFGGKVFACDIQIDLLPEVEQNQELFTLPAPEDIAYIIYTSGSTGQPKGVEVKHKGILNSVSDQIDETTMTEKDKFLLFFSIASDGSIQEILTTLLSGATVVLFNKKDLLDINFFKRKVPELGVTVFSITPSFLHILDHDPLETVRTIVSCAEPIKKQDALYYSKTKDFYNGYGPTETTVSASIYKIDPEMDYDVIPIGRPCANKQIYILDTQHRLMPAGTVGQIVISGVGLAKGYLNDPEMTSTKFVAHPFTKGELVYLSGDKGKIHTDGLIYFYGRMDTQVKLNGLRVDLGEIESSLLNHDTVSDCKVLIIKGETEGADELVAFYIQKKESTERIDYRNYLGDKIPEYMIPNQFLAVDSFKLTIGGKLDEKALIALFNANKLASAGQSELPATATETELLQIWESVLEKQIGVSDNFFENGGHSLKAAKVIAKIHSEMHRKVQVSEVFLYPTVQQLAKFIESTEESVEEEITSIGAISEFPASFQQLRFWTLNKFGHQQQAFNMPGVFDIAGVLDVNAFESAIKSLIKRHESLRTVFKESGTTLNQQILTVEALAFQLNQDDFSNSDQQESETKKRVTQILDRTFDLEKGPLIACHLLKKSENDHVLVINLHHIIADGWSMGIIASEIFKSYESKINNVYADLGEMKIQYKDYTNWSKNLLSGEQGKSMESYWKDIFRKTVPEINLPIDNDRPKTRVFNGSSISHTFTEEYSGLQKIARTYNASLFMILYANLQTLLYKYTGQKDIVIGTDSAGRNHQALENQVGNFLNTLPLRLDFEDSQTFKSLFEKAKEVILGAFENQQFPFERILELADFERNTARTPLFDVYFIIQNYEKEEKGPENLNISRRNSLTQISKFDLSFYFFENESSMDMIIEYNDGIFDQTTIENIKTTFCQIVDQLITEGDFELDQISVQSTNDEEEADFLSKMTQF